MLLQIGYRYILQQLLIQKAFDNTTAEKIAEEYIKVVGGGNRENIDQIAQMIIKNRVQIMELQQQGYMGATIIPIAKTGNMRKFSCKK